MADRWADSFFEPFIRERPLREGLVLEFGVWDGGSLLVWRDIFEEEIPIYGFDSFKGLPEPWNGWPVGTYATKVRISLPNTELIEGLFADTLFPFLESHPGPCSFVNIDCDLYSSARDILLTLNSRIIPGTLLRFDELYGFNGAYPGWREGEYRALQEWCTVHDRKYAELGVVNDGHTLIRVEK